eukprot:7019057-Alexandrium_andersonii.AAC.1
MNEPSEQHEFIRLVSFLHLLTEFPECPGTQRHVASTLQQLAAHIDVRMLDWGDTDLASSSEAWGLSSGGKRRRRADPHVKAAAVGELELPAGASPAQLDSSLRLKWQEQHLCRVRATAYLHFAKPSIISC